MKGGDNVSSKTARKASGNSRENMETGSIELTKSAAKTQAKMFQFMKTKKKGRRK